MSTDQTPDDRTPDNHPGERVQDKTFWGKVKWWWSPTGGRGYRDIWLIVITLLVWLALDSARDRVDDIQNERARSIRVSCTEDNGRNRGAKDSYDEQVAELPPDEDNESPEMQAVGRQFVFFLIDELVPVRNCEALVARSVERVDSD